MNRLISKGMPNNYLKVSTEKLTFSKLRSSKFKKFDSRSASTHADIIEF